jgi:Ubiquitin carboxyl-terminal hydrolase
MYNCFRELSHWLAYKLTEESDVVLKCEECGKGSAKQTISISPSRFFIINIALFTHGRGSVKKSFNRVLHLNLSLEMNGSMYDLRTVTFHLGSSTDEAHYVTAKKIGVSWYIADDARISKVKNPEFILTRPGTETTVWVLNTGNFCNGEPYSLGYQLRRTSGVSTRRAASASTVDLRSPTLPDPALGDASRKIHNNLTY